MMWREAVHLVPTRNPALLRSLLGLRIVKLVHYLEDPEEELLRDASYTERNVTRQQLFAI